MQRSTQIHTSSPVLPERATARLEVPRVHFHTPNCDPPPPTQIDLAVARKNGSTIAIDATTERMQSSKKTPTPSLSEIIYEVKKENTRLRAEANYERQRALLGQRLAEEMQFIYERLRMSIINYNQGIKDIESERNNFF
jgi:hypothetical protein